MKRLLVVLAAFVALSDFISLAGPPGDAQSFLAQVELRVDGKGRLVVLVDDPAQGKADTVERAVFYTTKDPLPDMAVKRLDKVRVAFTGDGAGLVRGFSVSDADGAPIVRFTMDGQSFFVREGTKVDLPSPIALTVVSGGNLRDRSDGLRLAVSLALSGGANPTFDEVVPEQYVTVCD